MREGMMDDCGYRGFEECCRYEDCCKDAYEQGRLDERADWECAAGELIVKYADDVYEALPEIVKQIRANAIDEYLKLIKQHEDITGSIDVYKCENIAAQLKEQDK